MEVQRRIDGRFQGSGEGVFDEQEQFEDAAVLMLRLIREERVDKVGTGVDSPNPFALHLRSFPVIRDSLHRPHGGKRYILSKTIADQLPDLWALAKRAVTEPELEAPLTRFDDAYDRRKETDRLVDYWVALESLYLKADTRTGMSEMAAIGISNYLGKNNNDRTKIYAQVTESYRLRSKVVHGERHAKQANFSSLVRITETLLRKTLAKRIAE
jgi:hypothetical protein